MADKQQQSHPQSNSAFLYGASVDIGSERELQEDFVRVVELDATHLLCIIADGSRSLKDHVQPGPIVASEIESDVKMLFQEQPNLFMDAPDFFLKLAMLHANRILGAFKMGNEELYSGYAASVSCCILTADNHIYLAHSGNTRIYMMRGGKIFPLTQDMTKGADLLAEGVLDEETYYVHPDRLKLTSCLGMVDSPQIQTRRGRFNNNDLILMTTDGIHYAIRPEYIAEFVMQAPPTPVDAAMQLTEAAKATKYPDNAACIVVGKKSSFHSPSSSHRH